MRIALIDNDKEFRDRFQTLLKKEMQRIGIQDCHIDCFDAGEQFLHISAQEVSYTMLFIEIQLPNMNGIELAGKLSQCTKDTPVIFVSRVNGYAVETYEVGAAYFLIKPVSSEAVYTMFRILARHYRLFSGHITFSDGFTCSIRDIVYIKQQRQKCLLYLEGDSTHISSSDINELRHLLSLHSCFCEVNHGVIVNLRKVKEINKTVLRLQNGHYITVSRRRMKEISEVYADVLFRCHVENQEENNGR